MVEARDLLLTIFRIIFWVSLLWITGQRIADNLKQRRKLVPLVFIFIGLVWPTWKSCTDLLFPIVSSGKIIAKRQDFQFMKDSNQYRITFPLIGKIEDVDVFYTSYFDENNHHIGRMNWVKYVDFRFDRNYIQSNHELNGAIGEHTIVLKYKTNLFDYSKLARQAEQSLKG